ncbi:hypothetical protein [Streptomyces capparidis]
MSVLQTANARPLRPRLPQDPGPRPLPWLAAVAVCFTVVQLLTVRPGMGLGWDETVYASQVDPRTPAAFFSAPRARGVTFLVAPVLAATGSVPVLRLWLAVLSGAGLLLALWVWRRLLPVPVLALAGALFCGLWVTVFYGPQVMPNLWVAFATLAAAGCCLRVVRDGEDLRAWCGLTAAVAFAALMRPTDAVWLALALSVPALAAWRPRVPVALAGGLTAGLAPWVAEAHAAYGGLSARLHRASEIQGTLGSHWAVDDHLRALGGRALCRPCTIPWPHPAAMLWWLALPVLAAAGVWAARRAGRGACSAVAACAGLCMAVPYLFTVDYAAPRFLLPVYALLAVPVAEFLVAAVRRRGTLPLLVVLALAGHLAVQYRVLDAVNDRTRATRADGVRIAAELRRQGLHPPCVVNGHQAIPLAHLAGCASRQVGGHDGSTTWPALLRTAASRPVAVLVAEGRPAPPAVRDWREVPLPDYGSTRLRAYLAPSAGPPR